MDNILIVGDRFPVRKPVSRAPAAGGDPISATDPNLDPETWVDQYGDCLYRFALAFIKDSVVAENLVQETFLAALEGPESFKGSRSVQTRLSAILNHKIVDYFRKKNREQALDDINAVTETVDGLYHGDGSWKIRPGKWDLKTLRIYEQQEFLDTLFKCLAKLPDRMGKVFMLREMEGCSTEEICNALQISATKSSVMLYRARAYLRHCLELSWFKKMEEENASCLTGLKPF